MPSVDIDRQNMTACDEVLTLSEAAAYLKLAERTMHRMIQRSEVPCARVGGQWRFVKSVLDDWLLSRMQVLPRNELAPLLDSADGIVRLAPMIDPRFVVELTTGDILPQLTAPLVAAGVVSDATRFVELLTAREQLSSTAIGNGVAVPHVRRPHDNPISAPAIVFGLSREGVSYDAPDDRPVHYFFLLSTTSEVVHLRLLKRIAVMFRDQEVRRALRDVRSLDQISEVLRHHENRLFRGG